MTDYLSQKIKIVSFIAIILVVLQHAINFTGYIDPNSSYIGQVSVNAIFQYVVGYGISRGAVAFFFILSGFLFFRNFDFSRYIPKLRSRVRTLLIPYVLWSAIGLGFVWILQSIPSLTEYFSALYTGVVTGQTPVYYIQTIANHGVSFQLWFLSDLMLYTLLAPLVYVIVRYTSVFIVLPLVVMWFLQILLPPFLAPLYRGGVFYIVGAFFALHPITIPKENVRSVAVFALVSSLLILFVKTCVAFGILPTLWLTLSHLDNMTIIMGIAAIWFVYDAIPTKNLSSWMTLVTPFTFFIYVSHEPLLEILKRIGVDLMGRSDGAMLALYIFTVGLSLCLTIWLGYILRRFLPSVFRVLTGGR